MMTQFSETDPLQLTLGPAKKKPAPPYLGTQPKAGPKTHIRPDGQLVSTDVNGRLSVVRTDLPPEPKAIIPYPTVTGSMLQQKVASTKKFTSTEYFKELVRKKAEELKKDIEAQNFAHQDLVSQFLNDHPPTMRRHMSPRSGLTLIQESNDGGSTWYTVGEIYSGGI